MADDLSFWISPSYFKNFTFFTFFYILNFRTEHGVLVWDIKDGRSLAEPLSETGNGDHCCSLAWITNNSNLLVAGIMIGDFKYSL